MVKYKKCIVPFCKASSRTCDKLFFGVPKQPQRRQDWLDAVGITLVLLGIKNSNSPIYVCEDHFEESIVEEKRVKEAQGKPFLNVAAIPSQNLKLSPVAIEEVFQPTFAIEHSVQKSFHVANMSDENYVSPNHLHDGEQVNVINVPSESVDAEEAQTAPREPYEQQSFLFPPVTSGEKTFLDVSPNSNALESLMEDGIIALDSGNVSQITGGISQNMENNENSKRETGQAKIQGGQPLRFDKKDCVSVATQLSYHTLTETRSIGIQANEREIYLLSPPLQTKFVPPPNSWSITDSPFSLVTITASPRTTQHTIVNQQRLAPSSLQHGAAVKRKSPFTSPSLGFLTSTPKRTRLDLSVHTPESRKKAQSEWEISCTPSTEKESSPSVNHDETFHPKPRRSSKRLKFDDSYGSEELTTLQSSRLSTMTTSSDSSPNEDISVSSSNNSKETILAITRELMLKHPRIYLGLDREWIGLLDLLSYKIEMKLGTNGLDKRDVVMIILRKLKMNESFTVLSHAFGSSKSRISRLFNRFLPFVSDHLAELIVWPSRSSIRRALPISFRKSKTFRDIQSVIDCLEIEMEKPGSVLLQALTWSSYKNTNTIKFLISVTPNGIITYISIGYSGRIADEAITIAGGFLEELSQRAPVTVLADRGFKRIEEQLLKNGCKLVRPPSVSADVQPTVEEVYFSRRVSGIRIHVERVIRRVREFRYVAPHACIPIQSVHNIDFAMRAICGLVNLQSAIIK